MSKIDLTALAEDVQAEHDALADLLVSVPEAAWDAATPAPRWSVRDQISHLAFFDGITRLAIAEPAKFERFRDELPDLQEYVDGIAKDSGGRTGPAMLRWWAEERRDLLRDALRVDPSCRVPWFGPSMSLASKLTARLMETWAHGQDVVDALALNRPPSERLKHVARIGVLAFPNSFVTNGLEVPKMPVQVTLTPPDGGSPWEWGDPTAEDRVEGLAEDFCLVVTQRRHVLDTSLVAKGKTANSWMAIAQAFAGPRGEGRKAGQFATGLTHPRKPVGGSV